LAVFIKNDVMEAVVNYAGANIQVDDWKKKYSALIALGCIAEGPEK